MCLAGLIQVAAAPAPATEQQAVEFWNAVMLKPAPGAPASANLDRGYPEDLRVPISEAKALKGEARHDAPTDEARQRLEAARSAALLDKTKLCKFFAKGLCRRGHACTFAHGKRQIRPQPDLFRTQMCNDFISSGFCRFGDTCRYAHSSEEVRAPEVKAPARVAKRPDQSCHSAEALASQLQAAKLEAQRLQEQLWAIQQQRLQQGHHCAPVAPPVADGKMGTEADWGATSFGSGVASSRCRSPTTAGGVSSSEDGEFPGSRSESSDAWDVEVAVDCEVVVRKTFLTVVALEAPSRRRFASAPPAARRACA